MTTDLCHARDPSGPLALKSPQSYHDPRKGYKPCVTLPDAEATPQRVTKSYPYAIQPLKGYFRLLAGHEFAMLKRAEHLAFTPSDVILHCDGRTLSYQYVEGFTIKQLHACGSVPRGFFQKLYRYTKQLHHHQMCHMDLGNSGNVIATATGEPAIIDFGSALDIARVPLFMASWLKSRDTLGVLKLWYRFDRDTMPQSLRLYFTRSYRKNIYTPKRLRKAFKRCRGSDRGSQPHGLCSGLYRIAGIVSLFMILLVVNAAL